MHITLQIIPHNIAKITYRWIWSDVLKMELTIRTMKALVALVSIRMILAAKSFSIFFEVLHTMKKIPNDKVISCTELNSSIHMATHLWSFVYLSNHERPIHFADVRILHGSAAWIWPNEVWFWKSASSNYDPQKHESEPNMYVVCCGQTYLTRVTDWLRYTGMFVW